MIAKSLSLVGFQEEEEEAGIIVSEKCKLAAGQFLRISLQLSELRNFAFGPEDEG